ncbi:hypothetical protein [Nocardioides sp. NPDC006273]|uniref:hypothetical protein n=1 Tax=Nocardioides sp. NPDC006273 TaxID=3155598 RepID=UPI0033B7A052
MPIDPHFAAKFPHLEGMTSVLDAIVDPTQRAQLDAGPRETRPTSRSIHGGSPWAVLHGHLNEDPRIPQVDHSLSILANTL